MVRQVGEFAFPMQSCKHQHKQNVTLGYPAVLSHLFYLPVTDTFYAMVNKFSLQLMCIQCSACINSWSKFLSKNFTAISCKWSTIKTGVIFWSGKATFHLKELCSNTIINTSVNVDQQQRCTTRQTGKLTAKKNHWINATIQVTTHLPLSY